MNVSDKTDPLILRVIICRLFTPTSTLQSYQYQQKIALWGKKGESQYLIHQVSIYLTSIILVKYIHV